jgi:hypothetical protein
MEELRKDQSPVRFYEKGEFTMTTVADIANKVYTGLSGREN